jgi:Ca2+-transporting ATPase
MFDPPRETVMAAIKGCHRAGNRVLMVTGDHAETARAIARQVGLDDRPDAPVVTGAELERMSDEEVVRRLAKTRVFARISPAQKHWLVRLLNRQGEVTAVTGDGVNDAPALKEAHIGVSMGARGTDVAKEASDIVATDDNFASVYSAVQEGRTAFANIRNVTFFVIATGVSEVLALLASLVLGMPLPMLPAQILWMNVVTEGSQVAALALEPGEREHYEREPRTAKEGVLSRVLVERLALVGAVMAAGTVGVFALERADGRELDYARSAALTALVMFQLFIVGSSRSEGRSVLSKSPFSNPWLFAGVVVALALHLGALYSPPGREILQLEPISLESWARIVIIAASGLVAAELHKYFRGPRKQEARPGSARAM